MPGPIAFISRGDSVADWRANLAAALGAPVDLRAWPDTGDPRDIESVLAWKPPRGAIATFPNLRLIVSLGMGVDHLLSDDLLPPDLPIVRIMDSGLVGQMSEYALHWALRHHREIDAYAANQAAGRWDQRPMVDTIHRRVGVLGLGEIGTDTARKFAALGFPVAGWSRTAKRIEGVDCFSGTDGFLPFLARSDILVGVLPFTPATADLLDARAFAALPRGAYVVNMGRGGYVVEEALLAAVDSGHLAGAALDVFRTEPLPAGHPFWTHPKIAVTPHVAGFTNPRTAAASVADNLRRLAEGRPLANLIDRAAGY